MIQQNISTFIKEKQCLVQNNRGTSKITNYVWKIIILILIILSLPCIIMSPQYGPIKIMHIIEYNWTHILEKLSFCHLEMHF